MWDRLVRNAVNALCDIHGELNGLEYYHRTVTLKEEFAPEKINTKESPAAPADGAA